MTIRRFTLFVGLWLMSLPAVHAQDESSALTGKFSAIPALYSSGTDRIITTTIAGNEAYDKLEELCIKIGNRLSGSPQLDQAIGWALSRMNGDRLENVHKEPAMVPHWVRGKESAVMVEPRTVPLRMLGLGGSVGTPPEGITAPVVVVEDEDALNALGDGASGKIVLFNKAMPPFDPEHGAGYGKTVYYRTNGARLAAAKGAVASLVRSVTAVSLGSPHTGAMNYRDAAVKIPTAAISVEDAELIARLTQRGANVVVKLQMEAKTLPDAESGNVIGELRGSTWPDEVVLISGHLDSWDVGQGAQDDGGGCVIAMEAANVLRRLQITPRRTIRVVLWTNEENGLAGAKAYAAEHADELKNHVAAIEVDSGVFRPTGYSVECQDEERQATAIAQLQAIMALLAPVGKLKVKDGGSGADLSPMKEAGVVLLGHEVNGGTYFNYHHSEADTIDKVDPVDLTDNVAALATLAFVLADMPQRLGSTEPNAEP